MTESPDPHKQTNLLPGKGKMLIAAPYLSDPGFARTVVIICEHGPDGSLGFVVNRPSSHTINGLLPELKLPPIQVYNGGPVQTETLHLLHPFPKLFGGTEITSGIFWGGNYHDLLQMEALPELPFSHVRMFTGYAGWGLGQLEAEIAAGSWIVAPACQTVLFEKNSRAVWVKALESLGPDFAYLANLPLHPQMN